MNGDFLLAISSLIRYRRINLERLHPFETLREVHRQVTCGTTTRLAAIIFALYCASFLAACGGGSSGKPTVTAPQLPQPPTVTLDLPGGHNLLASLETQGRTFTVASGETQDIDGVHFSCPSGGYACTVILTIDGGTVTAVSTGGVASAELSMPLPVVDPPAVGHVRVVDADTVDIDGTRYRLFGIDAPERHQTCRTWGRTWNCGAAATEALISRAEGMSCEGSDTDRYGRAIGVCSSGTEDLNAWLVAQGWALAYRQYAEDYVSEEEEARSNRRGIHRGEYIEPWNWRRGARIEGEDTFTSIASGELDVDALAERMLRGDNSNVYGPWLDDSVFGIVADTAAFSFGSSLGTAPTESGGAVWNGAMVGIDRGNGERIEGDAAIDIDDFDRPDVDIAFTSIEDSGGRARADLTWQNIPVVQGAFRARGMAGSIEGRFYGSGHEEVGGIFEHDQLLGAFGGSR